jgi:murein DD-endopeptidase MepM/ murein hydrolase activator NlpD
MRRLLWVFLLGSALALLLTRAEPFGPTVALEAPRDAVGRTLALDVAARDRGTGLAQVEIRLVLPAGPALTVARRSFPSRGLSWPWLVHEEPLTFAVDLVAARVPEGPATLEVWATDHSWLAGFRRGPRATHPVTVDLTPPTLAVLSTQHTLRVGGAECAIYRVGPDAVRSGVEVGDEFFAGTAGLFVDEGLRAALFAVPEHAPDARPAVVAADAAGNVQRAALTVMVRPRRFPEKTLTLSQDFLARKVPELLQAHGLPPTNDLVAGYLHINRELRVSTEARVREICREGTPQPLWQGGFLRLPRAAPLAGFGDRRTYIHDGREIDRQTHLGIDLASIRGSPVPAANRGRVVFAGPLGIYGSTVILDHGMGLFSLYGHLRAIEVTDGSVVERGDVVGRTGETGLAGGDHLHFSVMIRGVHVDPIEWWDAHWIRDHVETRLDDHPRAARDP